MAFKDGPDGSRTYMSIREQLDKRDRQIYKTQEGYEYTRSKVINGYDPLGPNHTPKPLPAKHMAKINALNLGDEEMYEDTSQELVPVMFSKAERRDFERALTEKMIPIFARKTEAAAAGAPLPKGPGERKVVVSGSDKKALAENSVDAAFWDDDMFPLSADLKKRLPWETYIRETRCALSPLRNIPVEHRAPMSCQEAVRMVRPAGLFLFRWKAVRVENRMEAWRGLRPLALMAIFRFFDQSQRAVLPEYRGEKAIAQKDLSPFVGDIVRTNIVFLPATRSDLCALESEDEHMSAPFLESVQVVFGSYFFSLYG